MISLTLAHATHSVDDGDTHVRPWLYAREAATLLGLLGNTWRSLKSVVDLEV